MNRLAIVIMISFITVPYCCCSDAGEARISFAGDIIMHIPVKTSAASHNRLGRDSKTSLNNGGFNFLFEKIKDSLQPADIVVGNMEFPVSPPYTSKPRTFNCTPDIIGAMKWAGFNLLTIGNNHVLDQGEKGVKDSMLFLQQYHLEYIGVRFTEEQARSGVIKTVGGIKIGFIGYTGFLNFPVPKKQVGYHLNWLYNREDLFSDIRELKKKCDYLVMVVHTGVEYVTLPRTSDTELFKKCVNSGADLIVAHHPHLLQPAEKVVADDGRTCYIFYSLGNFISNQSTQASAYFDGAPITTRDSVIVRCLLKRPGIGKRPEGRFEVEPVYTVNTIEEGTRFRAIQTVSVSREIGLLKKRLRTAGAQEKVDIERQLQNLYQKLKAIKFAIYRNKDLKEITFIEDSGGYDR